jgi:hypothetical protein
LQAEYLLQLKITEMRSVEPLLVEFREVRKDDDEPVVGDATVLRETSAGRELDTEDPIDDEVEEDEREKMQTRFMALAEANQGVGGTTAKAAEKDTMEHWEAAARLFLLSVDDLDASQHGGRKRVPLPAAVGLNLAFELMPHQFVS